MGKLKKKRMVIVVVLAVFCLGLGAGVAAPPAEAAYKPIDITGHWAQSYIEDLVGQGVIAGYPDGTFRPNQMVSRLEFMLMINRAFKISETNQVVNFYDVVNDRDWFSHEIAKAVVAGYMAGYPDHTIRPHAPINRQEATFIVARVTEIDTAVDAPLTFADAADIPIWSREAIAAMAQLGYISGYPDGAFRPLNSITRAEAAVIITRSQGDSIKVYNQAGTYGPESGTMIIDRDVIVTVPGVILQNMVIDGNLTIAATVGKGNLIMRNVTVKGLLTNYN